MAVIAPRLYRENLLLPVVFEPAAKLLTDAAVTGIVGVGQQPPITGRLTRSLPTRALSTFWDSQPRSVQQWLAELGV